MRMEMESSRPTWLPSESQISTKQDKKRWNILRLKVAKDILKCSGIFEKELNVTYNVKNTMANILKTSMNSAV
jgi:hypothetical protein